MLLLRDFSDVKAKKESLGLDCSTWLAKWDDFRTFRYDIKVESVGGL